MLFFIFFVKICLLYVVNLLLFIKLWGYVCIEYGFHAWINDAFLVHGKVSLCVLCLLMWSLYNISWFPYLVNRWSAIKSFLHSLNTRPYLFCSGNPLFTSPQWLIAPTWRRRSFIRKFLIFWNDWTKMEWVIICEWLCMCELTFWVLQLCE